MKKSKKNYIYVLITMFVIFGIYNFHSYKTMGSNDVKEKLNSKYSNDYKKILNNIDNEVKNRKYNKELKSFLKIYYSYFIKDYDFVIENYEKLEKDLIKNNLDDERLDLYVIMLSIYSGIKEYEMAYIELEKAEDLNNSLLKRSKFIDKEKYNEYLSTMMAIKYMKVTILSDLNLDDLADKNFKEVEEISKTLDIRNRIDIYTNKFMYYYNKGDYDNAYSTYEIIKSIPNNKNENTEKMKIKSLVLLSIMQVENGHIDLAIKNSNSLSKLDNELTDSIKYIMLELDSCIYKYYNKLDEAIDCLETAYEIVSGAVNNSEEKSIKILNSIIELYKLKGEVPPLYYEKYIDLIEADDENKNLQIMLGKKLDLEIERLEGHRSLLFFRSITIICVLLIITMIIISITIKISRENYEDALTKINNRKSFDLDYNKYLKNKKQFYLMVIDVDNFKSINDNYGHNFGDVVLINIAKEIKNTLKNTNSKIFRYGGEEFVIISKETDEKKVLNLAEEVRYNIESIKWDNIEKVTISIGVANSNGNDINTFKVADQKLYESKTSGKNKVTI